MREKLLEDLKTQSQVKAFDADGNFLGYEIDHAVFADLLLEQAVQVVLSQRDPMSLNYKPSESTANALRQHFGVA